MIDRAFLRTFNADALDTLLAVAAKHGVTIMQKSGTFARDGSNATIKFEIATTASDGTANTKDALAFKQNAVDLGLDPESLGTTFKVRGTEYRITGLVPRRHKYPISAERVRDGRGFKFPISTVASQTSGDKPEGLTPEIKRGFSGLVNQLSPENLTCDGECSRSEVNRRHAQVMREWLALEKKAGIKVGESQAESFGF